jgi:hypothetical protein
MTATKAGYHEGESGSRFEGKNPGGNRWATKPLPSFALLLLVIAVTGPAYGRGPLFLAPAADAIAVMPGAVASRPAAINTLPYPHQVAASSVVPPTNTAGRNGGPGRDGVDDDVVSLRLREAIRPRVGPLMVPTPVITDIDPPFARPGDQVTITGTNFIADGSQMTVTFQHAIADIVDDPGNSDTQLKVAVPPGAYSGGVLVCIASDNCSDPYQYFVRYEPQGFLASPSLSSIAGEPGTRSLWFGDRTQGFGRVYEIVPAGEVFERGALARSILAHPSPDDGSGRIYFCNSTNSTGNQGTILYVDSATNQEEFHRAAGAATTDPVWCRAIAANDLEPNVAYFLDGHHNTVRRVPKTGPINTMYGGQSFNFTDPAGARFDSSGNLYLTSTNQIVRILAGGSGVQVVASGFTAAAGIDLLEDGNDTLLAVADKGDGTIWLVNVANGLKSQVASGLPEPVAVAFSLGFGHQSHAALYVPEPTHILRVPDPRIRFERDRDQRIVLSRQWAHKYPAEDAFPSPDQTHDMKITVRVLLNPVMDPTGRTAHFQLQDPKDPSRYNPYASPGDNRPISPAGRWIGQASFDINGIATTEILAISQYSGNNFRITARLDSSSGPPVAKSAIYTTWRRVYVEHDRMWKSGAWVSHPSGSGLGAPGPAWRVFVFDNSIFSPGDEVHILSANSFHHAYGEFSTVSGTGVDANLGPYVDVEPELSNLYGSAVGEPPNDQFPYSFLARVEEWIYDVEPDLDQLAIAFDDAFTELVFLPSGGVVPHWPDLPGAEIFARSPSFFKARMAPWRPETPNTIQLVSAANSDALGWSWPELNHNWAWVFEVPIAAIYPDAIESVRASVTAHEIAHQFGVNNSWNDPGGGHCTQHAWTPSLQDNLCLMNTARDRTLGVVKMHSPAPAWGNPTNELMCIRSHLDDMDTEDQCADALNY